MKTTHKIHFANSANLDFLADESVGLIVTSPPYPMIEMWDETFRAQSADAGRALDTSDGAAAYEAMHRVLDRTWGELFRVLVPGGIACINIGDATRTIGGEFQLFSNHARILSACLALGFMNLPAIIWRKPTNAPNKFMGSGMLPPGAYVTLEHEFILVLRKGGKRVFAAEEGKMNRARSAFFWEERNAWFSDVWMDLRGARQKMGDAEARKRNGAFPFEVPYRLINMFSVRGDMVLDPFVGTGTTMTAAMASGRNSIGVEFDARLGKTILEELTQDVVSRCNGRIRQRLADHLEFVAKKESGGEHAWKYTNDNYGFPVTTRQERMLVLAYLNSVEAVSETEVSATYSDTASLEYFEEGSLFGEAK